MSCTRCGDTGRLFNSRTRESYDCPDCNDNNRKPKPADGSPSISTDLLDRIASLEEELKLTDQLLAERQRVLDAIPECEAHGSCVPHALEWIEEAKKKMAV